MPVTLNGPFRSSISHPRSLRFFISILEYVGASRRPGRCFAIYTFLFYIIIILNSSWSVMEQFKQGRVLVEVEGRHWVDAATSSSCFGVLQALQIATLLITMVSGRRKFANMMARLLEVLQEQKRIRQKLGKEQEGGNYPARWVVGAMLFPLPVSVFIYFVAVIFDPPSMTVPYFVMFLRNCLVTVFSCCFLLMPLKFFLACHLLGVCLDTYTAALKNMSDAANNQEEETQRIKLMRQQEAQKLTPMMTQREIQRKTQLEVQRMVQRLTSFQSRLSDCLTLLMAAMPSELLVTLLFGVVTMVTLCVLLVSSLLTSLPLQLQAGLWAAGCLTTITVLVPCEATQLLVQRLEKCRDLLMMLERQQMMMLERRQPAIVRDIALMGEAAARDLEVVGDLGLLRLRRSTVLNIVSTIITYVIVILQFWMPE
ncbi:hypothetical protein FJT64_023959 [Amphibalanus amphitrite]|uniref:Gustatory receptor n=1 Tax=Amphibalanus amphitrite TaxID=1232801 RepID=A0A6A4WK47_AMPAM|nr:hypothetical protein FJT64_023959 [Amphibalanus amphitrite]